MNNLLMTVKRIAAAGVRMFCSRFISANNYCDIKSVSKYHGIMNHREHNKGVIYGSHDGGTYTARLFSYLDKVCVLISLYDDDRDDEEEGA